MATDTDSSVVKITVSAAGDIVANGKPANLLQLAAALAWLAENGGQVWYHRENPQGDPHENAMKVIELVCQHKLAVRMFRKPDFSDSADEHLFAKPGTAKVAKRARGPRDSDEKNNRK